MEIVIIEYLYWTYTITITVCALCLLKRKGNLQQQNTQQREQVIIQERSIETLTNTIKEIRRDFNNLQQINFEQQTQIETLSNELNLISESSTSKRGSSRFLGTSLENLPSILDFGSKSASAISDISSAYEAYANYQKQNELAANQIKQNSSL